VTPLESRRKGDGNAQHSRSALGVRRSRLGALAVKNQK